ncbi:hypothetical protein F8M41_015147 [Gigaspora margarita]|uniref:Uncharacterized protein n=1 Tax=Gigaspora margarita TaxID=4874 RepID=A0A8H3ZZI5_GIGMA|nr:hypothetical protein F8M41_015147 [Gigaspora margarita]
MWKEEEKITKEKSTKKHKTNAENTNKKTTTIVNNTLKGNKTCDEKVEQELEVLKNITNKILAPRKDTLISENNDSSTPIVSASVDETTCEEVQEGPSNIEFKNAKNI